MRKNQNSTLALLLIGGIASLYSTGCDKSPSVSVESLGGGYEEVTYSRDHISEPSSHQITLQYRNLDGKQVMIWPSLRSKVFVNEDTAVFVGLLGSRAARFLAVKLPDQPMDITDEILRLWSKESGHEFNEALKIASASTFEKNGAKIQFNFAFWAKEDWAGSESLDWTQISDIMREVKEKGVQRKDAELGVSYLEKEFKPEGQR